MRITVVTPSFNQAKYVEATIASVLDQGYADLEYIVIDGGSTDGTVEILDRYRSHLAYVQSRPDGGQTDALIQGFARATGDVLAWLNSDDLYEPNTLREVADHFSRRPRDSFVFGDSTWIHEDGVVSRTKREIPFSRYIWLRTYNYVPQPSAFWTRDLYEEVGGLDANFNLAMDSDLWIRFAERTRLIHVPRLWSRMRMHPDQKNIRLRAESDREDALIRARYRVPAGLRGAVERVAARAMRMAWRGAIGAYWR